MLQYRTANSFGTRSGRYESKSFQAARRITGFASRHRVARFSPQTFFFDANQPGPARRRALREIEGARQFESIGTVRSIDQNFSETARLLSYRHSRGLEFR